MLIMSRLSLVETARAFLRVRLLGEPPEAVVADAATLAAGTSRQAARRILNPVPAVSGRISKGYSGACSFAGKDSWADRDDLIPTAIDS